MLPRIPRHRSELRGFLLGSFAELDHIHMRSLIAGCDSPRLVREIPEYAGKQRELPSSEIAGQPPFGA